MKDLKKKSNTDPAESDLSQKAKLMLLTKDVIFWHAPDKSPYVTVVQNDGTQNLGLGKDGTFRSWLTKEYYAQYRSVPSAQALQEVLDNLEGKAIHDGETHKVFCRVGYTDTAIYI